MTYPQAPWHLRGHAIQTLHLLDVDRVRPLIPSELKIVSPFPGKTVGGIYLSTYGEGSVLYYNELIVVCGLVQHDGKIGGWISHIYVDHPDSVAGGREIWGLPKQLAQFAWTEGNHPAVQVSQADNLLCTLKCNWQLPGWRQPFSGSVFSMQDAQLLVFDGKANFNWHLIGADLQIPAESPFAQIGLGNAWLSVYCTDLDLTVTAPSIAQERTSSFSYAQR